MSERYGICGCNKTCQACTGSGSTGDAGDYTEAQNREEWHRDFKGNQWLRSHESSPHIQQMENAFYKNAMTAALQIAVAVFQNVQKELKP